MALMSSPFGANSTKFYDETYTQRIYSVLGDVRKFEPLTPEPMDDTTGDPTRLTMTVTEAGAGDTLVTNSVTAGGCLKVVTAANEYDGANLQAKGETFKLETGKPLYFRAKVSIDNATESDLLVGLCETKTDLLKVDTAHGITATNVEGVFFFKVDGGTVIQGKTYEAGAETNSVQAAAVMTTSVITYEIVWDGSQLSFFVDGVNIGTVTANLPNGDLTPSINVRAGSAAARTSEFSMWCYQAGS